MNGKTVCLVVIYKCAKITDAFIEPKHFMYVLAEAVEQTTFSPVFEYKKVHHIPNVTPEFIKYLKGAIEMQIHVTQHIEAPAVSIIVTL